METKHISSSWCAAHLLHPQEAEVIFLLFYQAEFLITHFFSLSPLLSLLLIKSTSQTLHITWRY